MEQGSKIQGKPSVDTDTQHVTITEGCGGRTQKNIRGDEICDCILYSSFFVLFVPYISGTWV